MTVCDMTCTMCQFYISFEMQLYRVGVKLGEKKIVFVYHCVTSVMGWFAGTLCLMSVMVG